MARIDAIPRQLGTARLIRVRNMLVVSAIVLAAVAGPVALALVTTSSSQTVDVDVETAVHRGFAEVVAQAWVNGDVGTGGTPIPVAEGIDRTLGRTVWTEDGVTQAQLDSAAIGTAGPLPDVRHVAWDSAQVAFVDGRAHEWHRFVVATGERLYHLTVPVTETRLANPDDVPQPVLGGRPLLEPVLIRPETPPAISAAADPTVESVSATQAMRDRIVEWADAWAADNTRALYTVVGDSEDVTYRGLGGWVVGQVAIGAATVAATGEDGTVQAVTVEVDVQARSGLSDAVATFSMDLLMVRVDQPLPNIVAWGPRGSGPTLVPYEGAVPNGTVPSGSSNVEQETTDEDR